MSLPKLVVDKDTEIFRHEQAEWLKRGIATIRVDTMRDAIGALERREYLFIAINADQVDYMPMLNTLRSMTSTPIFILTSRFLLTNQVEALRGGADAYIPFQQKSSENILLTLALVDSCNARSNRAPQRLRYISYQKLFFLPDYHRVFCEDRELPLTKKEFLILQYLLDSCGKVVSYQQIYNQVWEKNFEQSHVNTIWNHILRMRKKIKQVCGCDYIENIRDIGYRIPNMPSKTQ